MDRAGVVAWVEAYERAWRTPGTSPLRQIFTDDVSYLASPWAREVSGLDALATFWEDEREGADEEFVMRSEIVAVDGDAAVVHVEVDYAGAEGGRWRDLWVLRFALDGRCCAFEEWPFAPDQDDGHGDAGG